MVGRFQTVTKYIRKSTIAKEKLETIQRTNSTNVVNVELDVRTCWNSTLCMLLKLVRLKTSICIFLQYLKSPEGKQEFNQKREAEKKLLRQKSANREVENYLDLGVIKVPSDVIPMDWWKVQNHQFPRIAKLARKWLCVTATSTPSERVFSNCGLALTAKLQG